jgi:hypothetical protein
LFQFSCSCCFFVEIHCPFLLSSEVLQ